MVTVEPVQESDREFWSRLDPRLPEEEFLRKVRDGMGYVVREDGVPAGLLRYFLFWDELPFCSLLYIDEPYRLRGYGSRLMLHWEEEMRRLGHGLLMTSTQVDEEAQHFYRKLGYRDAGGLVFDLPGCSQPMELVLLKRI